MHKERLHLRVGERVHIDGADHAGEVLCIHVKPRPKRREHARALFALERSEEDESPKQHRYDCYRDTENHGLSARGEAGELGDFDALAELLGSFRDEFAYALRFILDVRLVHKDR